MSKLINDNEISFITWPKYVGAYCLNNDFSISLSKKPNAWNRFWTKALLGWEWIDE
jgi:hypothetical protein